VMHQESGEHWARENQGPGLPILKTENRSPLFEIYAAFSTRLQISKLPERAGVGQSRSATGNCDDACRSYGSWVHTRVILGMGVGRDALIVDDLLETADAHGCAA